MASEINEAILEELINGISEISNTELQQYLTEVRTRRTNLLQAQSSSQLYSSKDYLTKHTELLSKFFKDRTEDELLKQAERILRQIRRSAPGDSDDPHHTGRHKIGELYKTKSILAEFNTTAWGPMQEVLLKYQRLQTAENSILRKSQNKNIVNVEQVMRDSYETLNRIGEQLRSTRVFYEVNFLSDLEAGEVLTGYLTLDQIIKYSSATSDGTLRVDTARLAKAFKSGQADFATTRWDSERVANLRTFINTASNLETDAAQRIWKKSNANLTQDQIADVYLNMGNILEAFRRGESEILKRMIEDNYPGYSMAIDAANPKKVHEWIRETVENTAAFTTGGDIKTYLSELFKNNESLLNALDNNGFQTQGEVDLQLKNINASITNLSSLLRMMTELEKSLTVIVSNKDSLRSVVQQPNAEPILMNALNKMVEMFLGAK